MARIGERIDIPQWPDVSLRECSAELRFTWRYCCCEFDCLCGEQHITITPGFPSKCCACGRVYSLHMGVDVHEQPGSGA